MTLPAVSLTLRDLENSAAQLARDLGRSPGTVSRYMNTISHILGLIPWSLCHMYNFVNPTAGFVFPLLFVRFGVQDTLPQHTK